MHKPLVCLSHASLSRSLVLKRQIVRDPKMPSTRFDAMQIDRSWSRSSSSSVPIPRSLDRRGMGTPAVADENNVAIKSNDSEHDDMEEPAQDETPAHFPLSTHEQLQAIARRREAALSFKHQVSECRLALRYSVIGWTGTLDPVSILSSASCSASSSFPLPHNAIFFTSPTTRPPS